MATPYDGKIFWIHWMGEVVGENDIRQLVATVKKYSPNVDGVVVKSSDGPLWMGARDSKKLMAITGLRAIQTWVAELNGRRLDAHLWATLRGQHANAEANLVIQAMKVQGVESMILDVNASDWYFGGLDDSDAQALAQQIRQGVGDGAHLGVTFDPRGAYPSYVYLDQWAEAVDSLHPKVFHWEYSEGMRSPEEYLDEAFEALAHYGKPVIPMLQTHKDPATGARVPENDVYDAGTYAFEKGAPAVTYYRLGATGPLEFRAVSRVQEGKPASAAEPTIAAQPAQPTPEPAVSQPAPVPVSEPSQPTKPEPEAETETWIVVIDTLNVRTEPGLEARLRVQGVRLNMGDRVEILIDSLHDDEGYTWARLKDGYWTAVKISDGSEVFVKSEAEVSAEPETTPPPAQPTVSEPEVDTDTKVFLVVTDSLRVRTQPSTAGTPVDPNLLRGQQVEVDPDSRTDANGLVWWNHETGWSAERTTGGSDVFMMEYTPTEAGSVETPWKFERLPVGLDVMQWFYYFGNTLYAFNNGKRWNYDGYSQGLHGGLDFGHRGGAKVYAGVEGVWDGAGRAFGPNRRDVIVGDYRIIYGHLGSPQDYPKGSQVTPDTVVGEIETSLQHLHLEIRYQGKLIVNPLQFIEDQVRGQIIAEYPPVGQFGFYSSPRWKQWLAPLDQPNIVVGGPLIGPRA